MWKEQGFRIFFLVSLFGFDVFLLVCGEECCLFRYFGKREGGTFFLFFFFSVGSNTCVHDSTKHPQSEMTCHDLCCA